METSADTQIRAKSRWRSGASGLGTACPQYEHLAVYGTLRRGLGPPGLPREVHSGLDYVGRCLVEGILWDLGAYPGLVPGDGTVSAELYRIHEPGVLERIDRYEGFVPGRRGQSLFVRESVRLVEPDVVAWVYLYNRPVRNPVVVVSGDWSRRSG